ncbi:MAG: hypothetical protein M1830_010288 [Pleopsidium flavum]|nr:MAG: hypothetical protein M1830_010288 [Pleopsidium flavum]
MPHTSHRKKATSQKRSKVTSPSGWTTITVGPKPPPIPTISPSDTSSADPTPTSTSTSTSTSSTISALHKRYENHAQTWEESACNRQLQTLLGQLMEKGEITGLDKCVCLGLGSVSAEWSMQKSVYQFAALEGMLATLRTKFPALSVYAQDPAFTTVDEHFLCSHNVTILRAPSALAHIGRGTFIYAPHCSRTAFLAHLEGNEPALVVGNDVEKLVNG